MLVLDAPTLGEGRDQLSVLPVPDAVRRVALRSRVWATVLPLRVPKTLHFDFSKPLLHRSPLRRPNRAYPASPAFAPTSGPHSPGNRAPNESDPPVGHRMPDSTTRTDGAKRFCHSADAPYRRTQDAAPGNACGMPTCAASVSAGPSTPSRSHLAYTCASCRLLRLCQHRIGSLVE